MDFILIAPDRPDGHTADEVPKAPEPIGVSVSWWLLLPEVFAVWMLWVFAAAASKSANQARSGVPHAQRHGVSFIPIIPIFPLGIWITALLVDLAVPPWGTIVVGWLHAALGVCLGISFVWSCCMLWRYDRHS
jgi:hypothetical protein